MYVPNTQSWHSALIAQHADCCLFSSTGVASNVAQSWVEVFRDSGLIVMSQAVERAHHAY